MNETLASDPHFQSLMQDYNLTKPKALANPTTHPLPDALCKILETWFWGHYSENEIKDEQAKCRRLPMPLQSSHARLMTNFFTQYLKQQNSWTDQCFLGINTNDRLLRRKFALCSNSLEISYECYGEICTTPVICMV